MNFDVFIKNVGTQIYKGVIANLTTYKSKNKRLCDYVVCTPCFIKT